MAPHEQGLRLLEVRHRPQGDLQAEVLELRVALARAEAGRDAAEAERLATREVVDLLKTQLAEARKPTLVRLLEAFRRR
jgi:hypothetical protein